MTLWRRASALRARSPEGLRHNCVIAASLAITTAAQPAGVFRAETRLVVLNATVKDARGADVTDLDRAAFTVYENGKPQPIALFRRDDVPVSLGLLINNSGSMRTLRARVEAAALAFVRASNPLDEVFVLNFADKPRIDVPLTSDIGVLAARIARVDSIGGTAMRDAVAMADDYLHDHASRDRRVLIIITDGRDNASITTWRQTEEAAQRSQTVVYAIGLFGSEAAAHEGRHDLEKLTEQTGGAAFFPAGVDDVEAVVTDLARRIRNQYTIGYAPTNQALDGTYRRIRVEARARDPLVVRTRAGYVAAATAGRP